MKYAYIFIEFSTEKAIESWYQFFLRQTREEPRLLPQIKSMWEAAAWRVAMDMRGGDTFASTTEIIMRDDTWVQEQLRAHVKAPNERRDDRRPVPFTPPGGGKRPRPYTPEKYTRPEPKGKGKGKNAGKTSDDAEDCNKFQEGTCSHPNCKYAHRCGHCRKWGHG